MNTDTQPPAKWKYTDQTLFRVCYTNLETGVKNWINHSLVKQLQSEAEEKGYKKGVFEQFTTISKATQKEIEEARADERKKIAEKLKAIERKSFNLDDSDTAMLYYEELMTLITELEQPVESSTNETKERK